MASYENCPEDVELVSVATLESVFEMEQVVVRLDANGIFWRVVENDSMILKDLSSNLGYSTLYVAKGREQEALDLLLAHRKQQIEGHECPGCKLWLGPSVDICPACGMSDDGSRVLQNYQDSTDAEENTNEEENEEESVNDEELDSDEIDMILQSLEKLQDSIEMIQTSLGKLVSRFANIEERLEQLEQRATNNEVK